MYLGIPLGADPHKAQTWKPIIDKMEKRLALWKARSLSRAGRLVLIKSVLNDLPSYYLSLFRIPKMVARRIIQLQRRFFWENNEGQRGNAVIAWDTIQKPVDKGGLGMGNIFIKNAALLFKWWWRFADDKKPLWKEIIVSSHNIKYLGDFQRMNSKSQTSIWGQLASFKNFNKEIQEVATRGVRVKVGDGAQTRF